MIVGVLQVHLVIHDAQSLKDKRRVVRSVKDRLHREHLVSVAEVASQENPGVAILAITLASADGARIGTVLDVICAKLRALTDAELAGTSRRLLVIDPIEPEEPDASDLADLASELLARAEEEAK